MIEFLNSIVHSAVEIIMEPKPAKKTDEASVARLGPAEQSDLLFRLYLALALMCFLLGLFLMWRF